MLALLGSASTGLLVGRAFSDVRRCLAPRMDLELTPTLIEWGCDAELWKETRNKQASYTCCAALALHTRRLRMRPCRHHRSHSALTHAANCVRAASAAPVPQHMP
jgi:hypothetical protein